MSDNKQPEQPQPPAYQQVDPRMLAAMYGTQQEDEIDLLEYWRVIWKRRWLIIGVVFTAAVLAAGYSLTLPNIYRAEVVITQVGKKDSGSMSLGGLGGLASMAGISLGGGGGNVEVNLAVLKSREFLWAFVKENKLKPVLFEEAWNAGSKSWVENEPTQWAVYRRMNSMVSASSNKKTGLVSVAVEWTDADLAATWANDLVARLNAHLRQEALERSKQTLGYLNDELGKVRVAEMRQALFDLISQEQKKAMLASTQKEYAFRVLDAAVVPDTKIKPKRSQIVILAMLVAGFIAVVSVFVWGGVKRRKQPEENVS
jgi:uncharacterized protein involved in exopolysaccharide biosynthesis